MEDKAVQYGVQATVSAAFAALSAYFMTIQEIADLYGGSRVAIFNRLSNAKRRLSFAGIAPSDMKVIRKMMKAG